jgi:hypothetical protein
MLNLLYSVGKHFCIAALAHTTHLAILGNGNPRGGVFMPYSIDWCIENEIVYLKYYGVVTVDELRTSMLETKAMIMGSSRSLVHIITCVQEVTEAVQPLDSLRVSREVGQASNTGWAIQVGVKSPLVKMGIGIGTSVFKMRTHALDSFAEAEDFLKEVDPTLSWDKANTTLIEEII